MTRVLYTRTDEKTKRCVDWLYMIQRSRRVRVENYRRNICGCRSNGFGAICDDDLFIVTWTMILILLWSCAVRSTLDVILRYSAAAALTAAARLNHDDDGGNTGGVGWWPASGVPTRRCGGARSREASTLRERPFRARARPPATIDPGRVPGRIRRYRYIRRVDNNIIFFAAASHTTDFASRPYGHAFFSLLFPLFCFFPVLFSFPRCGSFPHYTDSCACLRVTLFLRIFFSISTCFFSISFLFIYAILAVSTYVYIIYMCRAHV